MSARRRTRGRAAAAGRLLALGLLALGAGPAGAAADSCAPAMRLGADAPALAALAAGWRDRRPALLERLRDADPAERRGAARLLGVLGAGEGLDGAALVNALTASADPEVQRLGAAGLLDHLDGVAPARLLGFGEPAVVCRLLARHPSPQALDDPAVRARLTAWLGDATCCRAAASLLGERGTAAAWGAVLVATITAAGTGPDREVIVTTAHQTLGVLTRTQRSLDSYAGHYALLAKDWSDTLAAGGGNAVAEADPELQALVAALPDEAALRTLLDRGAAALAAVDQTQAGADRARRAQLQSAARLLARAVSPMLYDALGASGFDGMDAEATGERLRALERSARTVLERGDGRGLVHLLTYVDDREAAVRVAALDRLVRLSDERKKFHGEWQLTDQGLFPPGQCVWRLRRALTHGTAEEQVSALQLAGSLQAKDLGDEVVGLLLSPSGMVVETAIETIALLQLDQQLPVLGRLAADPRQPAPRRARLLELVGARLQRGGEEGRGANKDLAGTLTRIVGVETDPLVLTAARKALFQVAGTAEAQRAVVVAMLEKGGNQRAAGLRLLIDQPSFNYRDRNQNGFTTKEVLIVAPALPYLYADDHDTAQLAAEVFSAAYGTASHRAELDALFSSERRQELGAWCEREVGKCPNHLALAAQLGALPRARLIAGAYASAPGTANKVWRTLIASAPDAPLALEEVLAAETAGHAIDDHVKHDLIDKVVSWALLNRTLLEEVMASGAFGALRGPDGESSGSSSSSNGEYTRTVPTVRGTITLKGTAKPGHEEDYEDWARTWTIVPPLPTGLPDDAAVRTLASGLADLTVADATVAAYRDLVICLLSGRSPDARLTSTIQRHYELWKILVTHDPALRPLLVSGLTGESSGWYLSSFTERGNPDLLPAVVQALAESDSRWEAERFVPYLTSLPPAALSPFLQQLYANPGVHENEKMQSFLTDLGELPLGLALTLLAQGDAHDYHVTAYGDDQLAPLSKALAALKPEAVLPAAPLLRRLREAGPGTFAQAMRPLLERRNRVSAIWMRTNVPLQAGLHDYYSEALTSPLPDLWLVGAAIALREGTMTGHDFLVHAATLPPAISADASLVVTRYLSGKLAGEGPSLAPLIAHAPRAVLGTWLKLAPADPALIPALVGRMTVPADVRVIGMALSSALLRDRAAWLPIVTAVAAQSGGRLDYLLPDKATTAGGQPGK